MRVRLPQLRKQRCGVGRECGVGGQLRHQIVVVGIEPFRHFGRVDAVARAGGGAAAREAKVGVQCISAAGAGARRDAAEQKTGVQHVVVEGEIAHWDQVQPGLLIPMLRAQLVGLP